MYYLPIYNKSLDYLFCTFTEEILHVTCLINAPVNRL